MARHTQALSKLYRSWSDIVRLAMAFRITESSLHIAANSQRYTEHLPIMQFLAGANHGEVNSAYQYLSGHTKVDPPHLIPQVSPSLRPRRGLAKGT
eukprot:2552343-Amphidinium_carterae.1